MTHASRLTLVFMVLGVGLAPAFADTYYLGDPPSAGAQDCQELGGVYEEPRICNISGPPHPWVGSLSIASNWTLRILPGAGFFSGLSTSNEGLIENFGSYGVDEQLVNRGAIVNHHVITNEGVLENYAGTITNHASGVIETIGYIQLRFEMNIPSTVNNSGLIIITSDGELSGVGLGHSIINDSGGTIDIDGSIYNLALLNNTGGSIDNSGTIILNIHGELTNNDGATVTNQAGGAIDNNRIITNNIGAQFINSAGSTINNNSGGTINNHDEILNDGAITNSGDLYLFCFGFISGVGTLTGHAPIEADGPDDDDDNVCNLLDCAPGDGSLWSVPGELVLLLSHSGGVGGTTVLSWTSDEPGSSGSTVWDAHLGSDPEFLVDLCLENDSTDMQSTDTSGVGSGEIRHFLVRGENACGHGTAGTNHDGVERQLSGCP